MTTIAFRDGVLAADSLATREGVRSGHVDKIRKLPDGRLVALLGLAGPARRLAKWVEDGGLGHQPDGEGAAVIIIDAEGASIAENGAIETPSRAPFHAWGCGAPIAIGAMAAGATAEEAVRIAIEWDTLTGGEVMVLAL